MIYVVRPGDTLSAIARRYNRQEKTIQLVNQLPDADALVTGQALLLPEEGGKTGGQQREINGFAYPYISTWVLNETLSFLTRLSVFSYGFTAQGLLLPPALNDSRLCSSATEYDVLSALVLTPLGSDGRFSNTLVHELLEDTAAQQRLLQSIRETMQQKGYQELNIDFEYVLAEDRERFADFVALAAQTVGYPVSVCLAPKTSREQKGLLYEGKDYALLGEAASHVLLMTYEWGYKYGPPMAVAPLERVRAVVEYAVSEIPPERIELGLANYGYDWKLPYIRGESEARTIGNVEAVELAKLVGAEIQYDTTAQSPWFQYRNKEIEHIVWFEDVRSWQGKIDLVKEFHLRGAGIWQIMRLFRAGMMLLSEAFYHISDIKEH